MFIDTAFIPMYPYILARNGWKDRPQRRNQPGCSGDKRAVAHHIRTFISIRFNVYDFQIFQFRVEPKFIGLYNIRGNGKIWG